MTNRTILLPLLVTCLMLWSCDDTTKKTEGCGNGLLDLGEACDGSQLQGATCASLGFYNAQGALACTAECGYDVSACGGHCGDGVVDGAYGEQCDNANLNGNTCASLGFSGGALSCGANCTYDTSDCTTLCGNGIVEGDEACDDGNPENDDGCSSACLEETGWTCDSDSPSACTTICGDGLVVGDEACDEDELASSTCETLGYYGGTLTCAAATCDFVTTVCETYGRCGDGQIQAMYGEECEGSDLDDQTCQRLGYYGGGLACRTDCRFDLATCEAAGRCGDGIRQAMDDEDCDGSDLGAATCETLGYGGGALGCLGTCLFDLSQCADRISPNIGTLKYVPAGTFQRDETPTNLSTVSAFRMSQYEITRAQWTAVTGWADPSNVNYSSGVNDPVQMVNWYHAIAFCNRLSLLEGLTPVYAVPGVDFGTMWYVQIPTVEDAAWNEATANWSADGYRLPTEAEWMWAAMGADTENPGVTNTTGYMKAFSGSTGSNVIGDYAVFGYYTSEPGRTMTASTSPAGTKLPNELGLYDMTGNVWERLWNLNSGSPSGPLTDYRGENVGSGRLRYGGNWSCSGVGCFISFQTSDAPSYQNAAIGFRVVRN